MRQGAGWVALILVWTSGCSFVVGVDDECESSSDCPSFATCQSNLCIELSSAGACDGLGRCGTGQVCTDGECLILPRQPVTEDIAVNTTWTSDRVYVLEEAIFVLPDVVLTIQAGTQIIGAVPEAALVVDNGRLDVRGTREAPVVFTSPKPAGTRAPGDWAGVALVGDAPVNATTEASRTLEGIEPPLVYGGEDPDHNCGTLMYLRIEFAGFTLSVDNELNGLTLAGCGSDTLVDYVQVHKGSDDGIELFGGSANVRHAVITDPADDGLDWDRGWQGRGQFVVIRQIDSDKSGIEADNNEDGTDRLPRSDPVIFNLTIVGTNDPRFPAGATNVSSVGATLRRGTAGRIGNAIFSNQGSFPVVIDGLDSQECAVAATQPTRQTECARNPGESTSLSLEAVIFHQSTNRSEASLYASEEDLRAEAGWFQHRTWTSSISARLLLDAGNLIADPFGQSGNRARFHATDEYEGLVPPDEEFFDGTANFIGAVRNSDEDWTAGWTAYPEN